jgi:hypothetical protein
MRAGRLIAFGALGVLVSALALAWTFRARPAVRPAAAPTLPRGADGRPDLNGIWTSFEDTVTPFERPVELVGREHLTDEEVNEALRRRAVALLEMPGTTGSGPEHWYENKARPPEGRVSLVVEPASGRIPPLTPAALERAQYVRAHSGDSWEYLGTWTRCITRGVPGAMYPTAYNSAFRIQQTRDYVSIAYENLQEPRIIPMDGRPHAGPRIRQWRGNSRGRWEGDTLVVDVTNFTDKTTVSLAPNSEALHVIERFTRIDAGTMKYEAAIEDPQVYTGLWKIAFPVKKDDAYQMFEYACHEGNRAVANILSGARVAERRR